MRRYFVEHQALGVHGFEDGDLEGLHVRHPDVGAVPVAAFEQALFGEGADGFPDAAAGNAEGFGQRALGREPVAVPEMAFFHELPEALRELVVAPARARGGNGGICFGHKRILWSKLVRPIWAFSPLVNHSIPTFPKCPDKSVL